MAQETLKGKTALITGGAKRIGRQIALALAEEGVNIVLHYLSSAGEATKLCGELTSCGVKSRTIQADFSKVHEYETLVARTMELTGSLEILINNASIFPLNNLKNLTWPDLTQNLEVNAWVPFVLSREFARLAGKGRIINMLDSRIYGYDWQHVGYILSKHVLAVLTRMMALEFAPHIRVNGVAPGLILPPPGKDQSYLDRLVNTVPLKRHGDPADIAVAVVYLLKNDFVTGQVINVDGGRHLKEYTNGSNPD